MGNNQSGEGEDEPVEVKKRPSKKKPPQEANGAQRPPPTATPTQAAQGPPQQLPPGQSMPLHETFIAPGMVPNTMPAMPPPEYCPRPPATMMAIAPTMIASPMQKLPDAIRSPPTSVYLPMPQQAAIAGVPASRSVRSFTEAPPVAPPFPAAMPPPPDAGTFDIFGTPNLFGPGPRGTAPKVAPFAAPWAGKPVMPPNLMMTGQMPLMVPPPGVPQQQRSYVPPPQPQQQVPVMVPQQQRSYVPPPQMQQQVPSYVAPPPMAAPVQMPSYVAPPQMFSPLNSQVVVPPQSRSYVPPAAVSAAVGASGSYVPPVSVVAAMGASGSFVPPPQFAVPQPMPVQAQVAYAQAPAVVETFVPPQPGVTYVETMAPAQQAVAYAPPAPVVQFETVVASQPAVAYASPAAVVETVVPPQPAVTYAQSAPVVEFEIASQPAVTYASPAPIIETAIAPQPAVAYAQTAYERVVPSQAAFTYASQAPAVETVMTARQPAETIMTARPPVAAQVLSSPFTKGARVEYLARSNGVWYPGVIDGTDPAGYTIKLDVGESKIVPAFEAPSRLRLA